MVSDTEAMRALEAAVARLRTGLEADGYRVELSGGTTAPLVEIVAGPSACAECLVSQQLMLDMISSLLPDGMDPPALRYPSESRRR